MKHTLLCIDDEPANLDSLTRCLRKDYNVLTAPSGQEGLKILREQTVHVIVSDQQMPEMNGVEFLTQAIEIQPHAIRILLTGFADMEAVINAINLGQIYRYTTKPWEPADLQATIAQAVDTYELRATVRQQNKELSAANTALLSLDKLKTDFMLLVNHELRTPLTAISSYSQLLQEEKIADEHKMFLKKIDKNVGRLQDLIEDTLLLTKLKSSKEPLENETLDLRSLFEEIWHRQQDAFSKKNMELKMNAPQPSSVIANKKFVSIIFNKLIHNCFQHSPKESHAEIQISLLSDKWELKVKNPLSKKIDRTPEQLLNAFGKDEAILNHTGGAGLGLAVIQTVVQMFQGEVTLNYDDNHFELMLEIPHQ